MDDSVRSRVQPTFFHTRLHLGYSAMQKIRHIPAGQVEPQPRSGFILIRPPSHLFASRNPSFSSIFTETIKRRFGIWSNKIITIKGIWLFFLIFFTQIIHQPPSQPPQKNKNTKSMSYKSAFISHFMSFYNSIKFSKFNFQFHQIIIKFNANFSYFVYKICA